MFYTAFNQICIMASQRIACKAFEAEKEMVKTEQEEESWYSQVMKWFNNNDLSVKKLPPFQYL